jgi:hypothetical protein
VGEEGGTRVVVSLKDGRTETLRLFLTALFTHSLSSPLSTVTGSTTPALHHVVPSRSPPRHSLSRQYNTTRCRTVAQPGQVRPVLWSCHPCTRDRPRSTEQRETERGTVLQELDQGQLGRKLIHSSSYSSGSYARVAGPAWQLKMMAWS